MTDSVDSPDHYKIFPGAEAIDVIRAVLTPEEFSGYCKGNILKYRLRAGSKGPADVCIAKAGIYDGWLKDAEGVTPYSPWYPDDSGEWVECWGTRHDEFPMGVSPEDRVEVLFESEREKKRYIKITHTAYDYDWRLAVAYRIVK